MDELEQFKREYYLAHSDLQQRLTKVETIVANLVTRDDLMKLSADLAKFSESVKQLQTLAEAMATKNDVEWLKSFFWKAGGIIVSILLLVVGLVIEHVFRP